MRESEKCELTSSNPDALAEYNAETLIDGIVGDPRVICKILTILFAKLYAKKVISVFLILS